MYSVHLKSVYSCPASAVPPEIHLPAGWQLSWHQLETLKALRDPKVDVVFNTAMTGDGKSLAAYLDVLQGESFAIALYPTNALASDQENQIKDYIHHFQPANSPRVNRLNGPELEIYAENEGLRKGSAIASRSSQSEVLITNPDIFHYLHRGAYLSSQDNPDKLWNRIDKDFDLFIFDEFHVFSAPQIASVLNIMLLIQATNRAKKFLFLSATPSDALLKRLDKAGFRCRVINPIDAGKYQFPDTPAETAALASAHWRQVAHAVNLTFVPLEPSSKASEAWLKENQSLILQPFLAHPGTKGAIILNSIAAVKRLMPILRHYFAQHGLTVRENTGLSGGQEKAESLAADLVIGTSTIDVGVDFKINFLIFESSDAGNFIQRLGRLGRHRGYQKEGRDIEFANFQAYALVPNFFVERLFAGETAVLADGQAYDRVHFQAIIREKYRQINDFEGYYQRWGSVQSFYLAKQLRHPNLQQQYADSLQKFCHACEQVFDTSLKQVGGRIAGWQTDWQRLSGKKGSPIADDATSFRGSSPLQCGLYDLTEPNERDRFKTYDLPGILSNLEIEMWSKAAFLVKLKETATRTGYPIPKGQFERCLGFMKLRGYREERLNWTFTYPGDLQSIAATYQVQVLVGLQIWQPDNPWVGSINRLLKSQGVVAYVLRQPVREVRLRLQLPTHFQIYPISDLHSLHDTNAPYSVAFGQSALLLDTLAHRFHQEGGELWIA
ncbi:type I-D CRISPR-associated helicase Cas3' [Trichothermofontia sichuanensis B231]|uniref:type I-D CRISPR-associated helicase Cas3' n=1 Tax=Trichothermofontia sichuanensis TaxID=3045816 RepID=UPI002245D301|nr:type I-D CRISPR-associated helicase Cas3' [Trichothermofontia sichuanensis]UZQ53084.1 type I-D CRISPR-associated helicase Cas3' [Trichothermofontia sichuanensis B231]